LKGNSKYTVLQLWARMALSRINTIHGNRQKYKRSASDYARVMQNLKSGVRFPRKRTLIT